MLHTPLRKTLLYLALAPSLLAAGLPPVHAQVNQAQTQLLQQIEYGEQNFRDDIVADAISRLQRLAPNLPELLASQVRYSLYKNNIPEAKTHLESLRTAAPQSPLYLQHQKLIAIQEPPLSALLEQALLYAASGQVEQALRLYDQVYQGIFPNAEHAVNYHLLRLRLNDQDSSAQRALEQLFSTYPTQPKLLEYHAGQAFSADKLERSIELLRVWGESKVWVQQAADRELQYIESLRPSTRQLQLLQNFAAHYSNLAVSQSAQRRIQQLTQLTNDPQWQAGNQALHYLAAQQQRRAIPLFKQALQRYPDDTELIGGLGLAYLKLGQHHEALRYFQEARAKETHLANNARWTSLIASTTYWGKVASGEQALSQQRYDSAQQFFTQARRLEARPTAAIVGLANVATALGQRDEAFRLYQQALRLTPDDGGALRGINVWLSSLTPTEALSVIEQTPTLQRPAFHTFKTEYATDLLNEQLESALAKQDWDTAQPLSAQLLTLRPTDPWVQYRAAYLRLQQGDREEALTSYREFLSTQPQSPVGQYAYALLLNSANRESEARKALAVIPAAEWSEAMYNLDNELDLRLQIAQAQQLRDQGQHAEAYQLLNRLPVSTTSQLQLALWYEADDILLPALQQYERVLVAEPTNPNAQLGQFRIWRAQGRMSELHAGLQNTPLDTTQFDEYDLRDLAQLWGSVGDQSAAKRVLEDALEHSTTPSPVLSLDLSRLEKQHDPHRALQHLSNAFYTSGLTTSPKLVTDADKSAFTDATLSRDEDDWLHRSLRAEAGTLYQQQNPTIQLDNDYWGRRGGTPGISKLRANTTILHMDYPLADGKAFIQLDHVRLNAGRFEVDAQNRHTEYFGTCHLSAPDSNGDTVSLPGCNSGLRQKTNGTSVALGWHNENWKADLGLTPRGFAVNNWTGGVQHSTDLGPLSAKFTVSRRPISSSLLSFAGTKDPRTGITWGGVMATGVRIGLGWDQGEANGVWSSIEQHQLRGKNVANNNRTRIMGGYYRRLINKSNEELTVGVNLMYMRHSHDLGEYTLGHGGYYSPQQYRSMGLPVRYSWRNSAWSYSIGGSVSRSYSKSKGGSYYPLSNLMGVPYAQLAQMGANPAGIAGAQHFGGSTSRGTGYVLFANVEHRINNRWVIGAAATLEKSQDYSPNHISLYLRYTFEPWQGNLAMPPRPNTPYADYD